MHVCVLLLAHLAPTLAAPNLLFVTGTGATNDVLTAARKVNSADKSSRRFVCARYSRTGVGEGGGWWEGGEKCITSRL